MNLTRKNWNVTGPIEMADLSLFHFNEKICQTINSIDQFILCENGHLLKSPELSMKEGKFDNE